MTSKEYDPGTQSKVSVKDEPQPESKDRGYTGAIQERSKGVYATIKRKISGEETEEEKEVRKQKRELEYEAAKARIKRQESVSYNIAKERMRQARLQQAGIQQPTALSGPVNFWGNFQQALGGAAAIRHETRGRPQKPPDPMGALNRMMGLSQQQTEQKPKYIIQKQKIPYRDPYGKTRYHTVETRIPAEVQPQEQSRRDPLDFGFKKTNWRDPLDFR